MSFWAQFLISSIGGGALSTAVGIVVGFLLRRWLKPILGGLQETTSAANDAAYRAHESATASRAAQQQAAENTRQADATIEWLAGHLARRDAVIDELRERIDGLLGTRARQVAAERVDPPHGLLVPLGAGDDADPTTVTGRHRLHSPDTMRMQTIHEGDPS